MVASPLSELEINLHLGTPSQTAESEHLGLGNLMLPDVLKVVLMQAKVSGASSLVLGRSLLKYIYIYLCYGMQASYQKLIV